MNKLMKLIVILLSFQNLGLAQENTFYRKYNLSGMQGGLSMIETSDGGFVATGQHEANGSFGDCDTYVYRIDQCGNLVWMKLYGTEMQEGAKNIEELANGDFLIAGLAEFGGKGFMMRINNDGDIIWSKKFPLWMVTFTSESADGSILATAMGFGGGTNILKLDANGNLIWSKIINDIGSYGMFIKHLSNDDFVITSVDSGTSDFFAARLDPNGNVTYEHTIKNGNNLKTDKNYCPVFGARTATGRTAKTPTGETITGFRIGIFPRAYRTAWLTQD